MHQTPVHANESLTMSSRTYQPIPEKTGEGFEAGLQCEARVNTLPSINALLIALIML